MTQAQAISYIGNNTGLLYATAPNGTTILSAVPNMSEFYSAMRRSALTGAPLSGSIQPFGTIDITAVAGAGLNLNTLTINGVSQIAGAIGMTNADVNTSAASIATAVNAYVAGAGIDYSAQSFEGKVYLFANTTGSSLNGHVVSAGFDVGVTATTTDVNGGSSGTDTVDPIVGQRWFINPLSTATRSSLTGATEITDYIKFVGLQNNALKEAISTVTSAKVNIVRKAQIQQVVINSGGVATAVQEIVGDGFQDGDIIILNGYSAASSVTFTSYASGTDNLRLANGASYLSEGSDDCIYLRWTNDATNGWGFYEVFRTAPLPATPTQFRDASIPFSPNGTKTVTLTSPNEGGPGVTLLPQTDSHVVKLDAAGAVALTGNYAITIGGTPLSGDVIMVHGSAVAVTLGAFNLTVDGIGITAALALSGDWITRSYYNGSAWETQLLPDFNSTDFIPSTAVIDLDGAKLQATSIVAGKYGALSIVDADIANNTIDASTKILAASIDTTRLDATLQASLGCVYCTRVTITSAQILTGNSNPITLIPAQGVDKVILPVQIFSHKSGTVTIAYATNTTIQILIQFGNVLFTDAASLPAVPQNIIIDATEGTGLTAMPSNNPLLWQVATGDPTNGDFDMTYHILYRVLDII